MEELYQALHAELKHVLPPELVPVLPLSTLYCQEPMPEDWEIAANTNARLEAGAKSRLKAQLHSDSPQYDADDESLSIRASSRAYNASRADDDTLGLVSFSEFWGKPEI